MSGPDSSFRRAALFGAGTTFTPAGNDAAPLLAGVLRLWFFGSIMRELRLFRVFQQSLRCGGGQFRWHLKRMATRGPDMPGSLWSSAAGTTGRSSSSKKPRRRGGGRSADAGPLLLGIERRAAARRRADAGPLPGRGPARVPRRPGGDDRRAASALPDTLPRRHRPRGRCRAGDAAVT
jgi:hypothetical protein